jgi:hypothetical protein
MHATKLAAAAIGLSLARAASVAPAGAAPTGHHPDLRAGSFTVTASVDDTEPLLGHRITVQGKVRPAVQGAHVTLQVKYDGRCWNSIDDDRLNAGGKFRFQDEVTSVRERRYRVVKPAGGHRAAGRAATEKVTVFGWRPLVTISPVFRENIVEAGTTSMTR